MNVSSAVRTAKSVVTANSPVLLVGTAIAGVVATGILAAKGGYKARGIINDAEIRRALDTSDMDITNLNDLEQALSNVEPLPVADKFRLTWLCYAAPAITGASTIASVIGVHTIHTKRHAALIGLYAVASTKLDDLHEQAEKMLGAKKSQELNNALGQKTVDRDDFEDHEVILLDEGTELCRDEWSGRYFKGSHTKIEAAINFINQKLNTDGEANLNEYYDFLGLSPITLGDNMGWNGANIESRFGSAIASNGKPVITSWFQPAPRPNLGL